MCLVECPLRLEDNSVFLPFLACNVEAGIAYLLVVGHGGIVYKVYPQLGGTAIGNPCPYREAVVGILLKADAEESLVLNHGMFLAVSRWSEAHIVRVSVEWSVILY